jgi:hypothetical protein
LPRCSRASIPPSSKARLLQGPGSGSFSR